LLTEYQRMSWVLWQLQLHQHCLCQCDSFHLGYTNSKKKQTESVTIHHHTDVYSQQEKWTLWMISSINKFATMRPSSYLLVLYKLMEAQMMDSPAVIWNALRWLSLTRPMFLLVLIADNNLTDLSIGTFQPSLKLYTFPYRDPRLTLSMMPVMSSNHGNTPSTATVKKKYQVICLSRRVNPSVV
jgi:uncharacterized protein YneF (UPF0154 family)